MNPQSFLMLLPEILLSATLLVVLCADLFLPQERKGSILAGLVYLGALAATLSLFLLPFSEVSLYGIADDLWRRALALILMGGFLLTLLIGDPYLKRFPLPLGEYYILLLTSLLGMLFLASLTHLGYLFLGIELMSLPLYGLCALRPGELRAGEGALKYFVLGSVGAAFLLLGISLFYLSSGSMAFSALKAQPLSTLLVLAWFFLLIGLAFKFALVPFHFWSPDAYEGAPLPVTAWMSTGVKVAIAGVFARLWLNAPPQTIVQGFGLLLFLTVILGNLLALRQENFKRFFAYSSIAHAGYIGVGLFHPSVDSLAAVLFYLLVYTVTNLGGFAVLVAGSGKGREGEYFPMVQGLSLKEGFLSLAFTLVLLSLAGIPPLGGFTAKLFLFTSAIEGGALALVIAAIVASLAGIYYYVRPVVAMFMEEGKAEAFPGEEDPRLSFVLVLTTFLLFYFGLFPGSLLQYFREVAFRLIGHGQ